MLTHSAKFILALLIVVSLPEHTTWKKMGSVANGEFACTYY